MNLQNIKKADRQKSSILLVIALKELYHSEEKIYDSPV
jgi:hypothetical protein